MGLAFLLIFDIFIMNLIKRQGIKQEKKIYIVSGNIGLKTSTILLGVYIIIIILYRLV